MNRESSLYRELKPGEARALARAYLGAGNVSEVTLLRGGMFNTTYLIVYEEGAAVMRLGPVNRHLLLRFEENLMEAERWIYPLCEEIGVPSSHILACDTEKRRIDRDIMFVRRIEGQALSELNAGQAERAALYEEVGGYMARFHAVKGERFGRVSEIRAGGGCRSWPDWLESEITDILERSRGADAFSREEASLILGAVRKHRALLDEIETPHLTHCDLWEGNVLVSGREGRRHVSAIIDADRAVFGDVDFEFASPWMTNGHFMRGYGMDMAGFQGRDRALRRKIYLMDFHLVEAYVGACEYNRPAQYRENKETVLRLARDLMA